MQQLKKANRSRWTIRTRFVQEKKKRKRKELRRSFINYRKIHCGERGHRTVNKNDV